MAAGVQGTPAPPKKHWNEHKHLYMARPRRTSSSSSSSRRDDMSVSSIASSKGTKGVACNSAGASRPKTTTYLPPPTVRPILDGTARRTSDTRERLGPSATKARPPLRPRQEAVSRPAAAVEVHQPAPPKRQLPQGRPTMRRGISQFVEYVGTPPGATGGGKSEEDLSRQRSAEERKAGAWDRGKSGVDEVLVVRDRRASVGGTGRRMESVEGKRVRFEV